MVEYHPVTEIFPLMQGEQYDQLVQDIRENDLREAIWLHPDKRIIDGRNRHRACLDADVKPRFQTWDGDGSLIQFVVSLNLHRRHLTSSQRAAAAAEALDQLKAEAKKRQREGGKTKVVQKIAQAEPMAGRATAQAAEMFGTNRTYVAEAAKIKEEDPEKFEEVKRGVVGIKPYSDARRKRERNQKEFEQLCKGKKQLVARMKEAGLKKSDQLKIARWSDLWNHDGHDETKWANRVLDLYADEVPLNKAMDQADKESQVERDRKHREEYEREERLLAEKEDRGFREQEPFKHFAEFLLKIEPLHHSTGYTSDYELIIRHLKNCKLTKLTAAIEKLKAKYDAEDERISA